MTAQEEAREFYERVLEGTGHSKKIVLPHNSGSELRDVKMTVVSKDDMADAIGDMPDELFEAAEEGEVEAEDAEEIARERGNTSAINRDVVQGFEQLCNDSLEHPGLSSSQMEQIIDDLSFEGLFELGSEVLNFSFEHSGDIEGFREQN